MSESLNASRYIIQRSDEPTGFQAIDTVKKATYLDNGLNTLEKEYYYRLQTIGKCGNLSKYTEIHKSILLKVNEKHRFNQLNWGSYGGEKVKRYIIYREGKRMKVVNQNTLRYKDTRVTCDSLYNYRIEAVLENSRRSYSNEVNAKPLDTTFPESVYLNRVTFKGSGNIIEVNWKRSEEKDAIGYFLYRKPKDGKDFQIISKVRGIENTTYLDTLPASNSQYCYRSIELQ